MLWNAEGCSVAKRWTHIFCHSAKAVLDPMQTQLRVFYFIFFAAVLSIYLDPCSWTCASSRYPGERRFRTVWCASPTCSAGRSPPSGTRCRDRRRGSACCSSRRRKKEGGIIMQPESFSTALIDEYGKWAAFIVLFASTVLPNTRRSFCHLAHSSSHSCMHAIKRYISHSSTSHVLIIALRDNIHTLIFTNARTLSRTLR